MATKAKKFNFNLALLIENYLILYQVLCRFLNLQIQSLDVKTTKFGRIFLTVFLCYTE